MRIDKNRIVDRAGKSLTVSQIEHYENLLRWASDLARDRPEHKAQYDQMLQLIGQSA